MLELGFTQLSPLLRTTTQLRCQSLLPKFQRQSHFSLQLFSRRSLISQFLANRAFGNRKFCLYSSTSPGFSSPDDEFDGELDRLLVLLPEEMRRRIREHEECHQLIEVVLDLGRKPLARFPTGDFVLSDSQITVDDLRHATSKVSLALPSRYFIYFFDKIVHILFDCLTWKLEVQYNCNIPSYIAFTSSIFISKAGG